MTTNHSSSSRRQPQLVVAAVLFALSFSIGGDAFTTPLGLQQQQQQQQQQWQLNRKLPSTTTRLRLVPEQGSQLVAAFHALTADIAEQLTLDEETRHKLVTTKEAAANASNKINITTEVDPEKALAGGLVASAARTVVSRIFSIPGAIMGRHPAAAPTILDGFDTQGIVGSRDSTPDNEVVLYPIVGFQFVQVDPQTVRVLPTVSNPSCRIFNKDDQELYGWFSSACRLESFDSDHYCDGWKDEEKEAAVHVCDTPRNTAEQDQRASA